MKKIIIIPLLVLTSILCFSAGLKGQDAREVSKNSADIIALSSMEMVTTLKIYDQKNNMRTRKVSIASKKFGDVTKMIMKFVEPADVRGTAILVYDYEGKSDDMWIYMPALKKSRRIVSTEKGKNFMGSEFTNADMSKPNIDDFNYKILSSESLDGKNCFKIEATPKTDEIRNENGFGKKITYIEKSNYLCHKIEYYDLNGKLSKTQIISEYKPVSDGKYFYYLMEMKNEQTGRKSVLTTDAFQVGSKLSESFFSPANLEKQ